MPIRGIKIDIAENIDAITKGERKLSNLNDETFFTKSEEINGLSGKELLKKLGLDTLDEIDKYLGKEIKSIEFSLDGLDIRLPTKGNTSFVKGGITSYGTYEAIVFKGKPSIASNTILIDLNGEVKPLGRITLSESEVREIIETSLYPPLNDQVQLFINKWKQEGRL